jgi:formylglycine-generating enzyme required for sulfatase activity
MESMETDPGAQDVIRPSAFKPTQETVDERPWHQRHRAALIWGLLALAVAWFLWFIFTAKSVRIVIEPREADWEISGGFDLELGGVNVLRQGNYELEAEAGGYLPLTVPLTVGEARNQEFRVTLQKLPGLISFSAEPGDVTITIDDTEVGTTPLVDIEVPAGDHQVLFSHPRYQPQVLELSVEGKHQPQSLSATLAPNWADVTITTAPAGATIFVDDQEVGVTPAVVELVAGRRDVRLKLSGYKAWQDTVEAVADTNITLANVNLAPADGLVNIATSPQGAGVTIDGQYHGTTPLEVSLKPGRRHRVRVFKPGFQAATRSIDVRTNEEHVLKISLAAQRGTVVVRARPADANLYIDGVKKGPADQTFELSSAPHKIEISKEGYAAYTTTLTPQPGLTQEVKVRLLTLAEARMAALKPRVKSGAGDELILMEAGTFTMGASRREPGRRANEPLRQVTLSRLYYLASKEVTNKQFRVFAAGHSSEDFEEQDLNDDDQPAVNVGWQEAALYCNWLSKKDKLPAFYAVEFGKVVGIDASATGYRLPTEAEWAWAARTLPDVDEVKRFPWGTEFPPKNRHGNYADLSASHLVGRVIFGYNDNYMVSSPVATFAADDRGFFDLGGNVAEWVNDFYAIPSPDPATDPLGPESGEYHLIKGSSWMHGTITDLRLSYRDYGVDGRADLGFRIARFAE